MNKGFVYFKNGKKEQITNVDSSSPNRVCVRTTSGRVYTMNKSKCGTTFTKIGREAKYYNSYGSPIYVPKETVERMIQKMEIY